MKRVAIAALVILLTACGLGTKPSGWAETLAFETNSSSSATDLQILMDKLSDAAGMEATSAEQISQRNRDIYELMMSYHADGGQGAKQQLECMIARVEDHDEDPVTAGETCHNEWRARFN